MAVTPIGVVKTFAPLGTQGAMVMEIGRHDLRLPLADIRYVHGDGTFGIVAKDHATTRRSNVLPLFSSKVTLMKNVEELGWERS